MEPLASIEDLRGFLDDPLLDEELGLRMLRIASGEVRAYAGQDFTAVTDDDIVLDGTGTRVILLPELPVLDVSVVEEGAGGQRTPLDGPAAARPVWEWSVDGILRLVSPHGRWARRFRFYRVIYSHGYDPIPDEVIGVVLRIAARGVENPEGMRQESLGRYSYTTAGEQAGLGLYGPDRQTLDRGGFVIGTPRGRSGSAGTGSGSGS